MKKLLLVVLYFVAFLWVLSPCFVHAQNRKTKLDSLVEAVDTAKDINSVPLKTRYKLAQYYAKTGIDSLFMLVKNAKDGINKVVLLRRIGIYYNILREIPDAEIALKYFTQALQLSLKLGFNYGIFQACNNLGNIYYRFCNYPEAEKYYLESLSVATKMKIDHEIALALLDIGSIYQIQKNYPEALKYDDSCLHKLKDDEENISYTYESIGEIYEAEKNYPEALKYSLLALSYSKQLKRMKDKPGNMGILTEIADIYQEEGDYKEAQKYYLIALDTNFWNNHGKNNEEGLATTNLRFGTLKIRLKEYSSSKQYLNKGLEIAEDCGARDIISECYKEFAQLYTETGDYRNALANNNLYLSVKDSIMNTEASMKLVQIQMENDFDKKEAAQVIEQDKKDAIQKAESKRKSIITGSVIIISLLTLILALVYISRQRLKRKNEKILFENETNRLLLEKQKTEGELAMAKVTLDEYVINMTEKSEMLEQFKIDMEKLKSGKDKESDMERMEKLEYLNKATILTDEDWNKFKLLYEGVHKDFIKRLKDKMPDLTQAEIRLICLTKLELGTKQMAGILGVSFDTIRKSRYRLRKKLGLMEEDRIDDIIATV